MEQTENTFHLVVDIAEGPRLHAIAKNRQILTAKRLPDKGWDYAAVVKSHSWSVCVEDADDSRIDTVKSMIGHCNRLLKALGFVVNATRSDCIDVAVIFFGLRMHERIAINFRCGSNQDSRFFDPCQSEQIMGAEGSYL